MALLCINVPFDLSLPLWDKDLNNSITNMFRAQMMQQSSVSCFCLPFFGKKKVE